MPFEETAVADQPTTETSDQSVNESVAQDSSAEATGSEQAAGAQPESGQESTYQLPDEQSKVFPEDVLLEFAQNRYPELAKVLADPAIPESTRKNITQVIHDKLNGDIYIQRLKAAEQGEEAEEVDEADEPTVEADPAKLQEHWNEAVTQFVDRVTDPKVAQTFTDNFTKAFDIQDPQQRAIAVTKTLSGAAVNLMRDAVPELLFSPGPDGKTLIDRYMESKYEGLPGMVKTNAYGSAWDNLRQSDPKFANVPAYNTPEWKDAIGKVAEMVPGFEDAVFTGKDGRVLSPYQNFVAKSRVAISLMQNLNGNSDKAVAAATKAVETGKKLARAAAGSQANAKLGAGQSRGQLSATASDPLKEAIAKHRADNGFTGLDTSKVITSGPGQR
jgi:hypothetical protein